jgi:secreted protein with Ig-like and vWFA domain
VILPVPSVRVLDQIKSVWYEVKKPATVVLTFDRSGSMSGEKIGQAINGAIEFVEEMNRKDWIAWKPFSTDVDTGVQGLISDIGEELVTAIRSDAKADGETALYDG